MAACIQYCDKAKIHPEMDASPLVLSMYADIRALIHTLGLFRVASQLPGKFLGWMKPGNPEDPMARRRKF